MNAWTYTEAGRRPATDDEIREVAEWAAAFRLRQTAYYGTPPPSKPTTQHRCTPHGRAREKREPNPTIWCRGFGHGRLPDEITEWLRVHDGEGQEAEWMAATPCERAHRRHDCGRFA